MAEMLLINPRKRTRRASPKKRTAARRRNPVRALAATHAPKRRRRHLAARRRNPIGVARVHKHARRRNPIGGVSGGIMGDLKNALLGGAGAVAIDVLMGQLDNYLPASMARTPGTLGVGDAVKVGITIAFGKLLDKPTKGLSRRMAAGALTVQFRDVLASFVPTTMKLGYYTPARLVHGTQRINAGAERSAQLAAYQTVNAPNKLLGLNAYQQHGGSRLLGLNGLASVRGSAAQREGWVR